MSSTGEQDKIIGIVHLEEKRTPRRVCSTFQYLKRAYKKDWETLIVRECSGRTGRNGFKLKRELV